MNVTFDIPGRISGKGRPRFLRSTGHVYTDEKTRVMEDTIRAYGAGAMRGQEPLTGPIELSIAIRIMPPMSWSKRRKELAHFVTGKPDIDNVVKAIGDALNGIVWQDDSQIAQLGVVRMYTREGPERATIRINELNGGQNEKARMTQRQEL